MANSNRGRKNRILLVALVIACIAIIASGTLAFFAAEETAKNVITTGKIDIDLKEETDGGLPWPEDGFDNIEPGDDVTKKVYGENNGTVDFYLRVKVVKTITDKNGKTDTLSFDKITIDINTTDWTEKEGYYYYNKALKPGEKSVPLFTKVSFADDLTNEYMKAKVEIDVTLQAVQAKNNGNSAQTATGWPVE